MSPVAVLLVLLLVLQSTADTASAHVSVRLNLPTFSGSGCASSDDRVTVKLSDDGGVLLVAFPRSFAAANDATAHTRVACNGVVPLAVPEGFAVGISSDELSGAVAIPEEVDGNAATHYAQVSSEVFFAPQRRGPRTKQRFDAPGALRFSISLPPPAKGTGATTWSACGGPATLRLNTALVAHGRGASVRLGEDAFRYTVRYNKCGGSDDNNDADNDDKDDADNDSSDTQAAQPSVRRV